MSTPLVSDDLWEAIEPFLPTEPPKPTGGRPRVPNRAVLGGIVFVLRTGCPWRLLPRELGCGSGVSCWRRLRDWQQACVWEKLHTRLLNWLGAEAAIDWSRASLDSVSIRAKRGAKLPAPIRSIAARPAPSTTWSSIGTASPWPFASRPRKRPAKLHTDKAYDAAILRRSLRDRSITPRITRRGIDSSERLGWHRWVVERTFAWLLGRRLGVRYERRADLLQGLLHLAGALMCLHFLGPASGCA